MQYYHLIAGLPDLSFGDAKMPYTVDDFKQQLDEVLSDTDKKPVYDIFLKYDNDNLLAFLNGKVRNFSWNKDAIFNAKSAFSQEEIAALVQDIREEENLRNKKTPSYFKVFISDFITEDETSHKMFWEDQLASLYYDYLGRSNNKFIRSWAELNLNINNVMTALTCRRNGTAHVSYIVGNNEVAENLRTSNARDFGLTEIFEHFDALRRIDEDPDFLEKEHQIDRLRWRWIDETNFFNYFTIEHVIGYLFKLQMLERWAILHEDSGKQMFSNIVNNMKKGALNLKSEFI